MRRMSSKRSSGNEETLYTVLSQVLEAAEEEEEEDESIQSRPSGERSRSYPKMGPLNRRNKRSGCWIPKCSLKHCKLSTHQKPSWIWRTRSPSTATSTTTSTAISNSSSHISIERVLDEIPNLPEQTLLDGEMKELFHQFVSYDIPRLCCLFEPPSLSSDPKHTVNSWQQEALGASLSCSLSMLVYVCLAHINRLARCEQLERSRISTKLYGQLLKLLRENIEHFEPTEAGHLIVAFTALVLFDVTLGHIQAVETHRTIFPKLVHHYGLYNHAPSLASHCVLLVDRLTATLTGNPPLNARKPDRRLYRVSSTGRRYGARFEYPEIRISLSFDDDVAYVCEDICRAIEIIEREGWTFQPGRLERPYNAADIQYLYFLRNNVGDYISYLQGKDLQNPDKNRPILVAALLVEYIVLQNNHLPFWSTLMGDQLLEILKSQNLESEWENHEDVLCWLMCVMMITPKTWVRRPTALKMVGSWLSLEAAKRSMDEDHSRATVDAICNPHDFVWSASVLDKKLSAALQEVQSLTETGSSRQRQASLAEDIWREYKDNVLGF